MPSSAPNERQRQQSDYVRYAGLGMQFAGTFLLFGAFGYWLDGQLGTRPWLMIVGIALGASGAFWSLVRKVPPARGSSRQRGDGEGPPHP
jgi:F0F1-type ATP synthase assembly protein I